MDPLSILLIFSLSVLSLCLLFFNRSNQNRQATSVLHGLEPYPILGHLPQFLKNRHRFHDWITGILAATPTNSLTFRRPGTCGVITANSAVVEHILKSNFDNYPKGPRFISILKDFLGTGIFNADGHLWKVQRKTASYEFSTRSLRNFVVSSVQQETAGRLLPLLEKSAASGGVIDIQDVLERYAFDNVCMVAFNEDPACLAEGLPRDGGSNKLSPSFTNAFRDAADLSFGRFRYAITWLWKVKKLFHVGSERRLREAIETVHDFATKIIRSRMKEREISLQPQNDDLLSRFVANEDYSEEFLRDIVISFILAGRETTSSALTWFFWLLSSRPGVEKKILEEIKAVRAQGQDSGKETFEFDELREMQYLHAAISEAMRLYPPVPMNNTACQADETLPDGTEIKKGWVMLYSSYAMGRMERIWGRDCREYKPERWLDETGAFRPESPFKFLAFHGGPRMCLGKEMAYIQMKSIVACMLERYAIEVVDKEKCPEQLLSLTLRMRGGLAVRVRNRDAATTNSLI